MNLRDALRNAWTAQEQDREDGQKFEEDICQCCGYWRKDYKDPECVCAGLDWYMDKAGHVECQAHRFARAVGEKKQTFIMKGKN
jgi:hypothetical protein